jgi:uridine phosphorylase
VSSQRVSETDFILREGGTAFHIGLTASQVPSAIIAVGDPDRVEAVSRYFSRVDFKLHKREFVSHLGRLHDKDVLVISTGIGPDNVEIVLTELDGLVNIDPITRFPKKNKQKLSIIRVGTSGALQADIPVGSFLISNWGIGLDNLLGFYQLPQTDFESATGKAIQQKAKLDFTPYVVPASQKLVKQLGDGMLMGNTLTCPGFYAPQGRKVRMPVKYPDLLDDLTHFQQADFRLTNFEMETSTYYAFGRMLDHDLLSANAILVNRARNEFADNPGEIVDRLIRKVLERV